MTSYWAKVAGLALVYYVTSNTANVAGVAIPMAAAIAMGRTPNVAVCSS